MRNPWDDPTITARPNPAEPGDTWPSGITIAAILLILVALTLAAIWGGGTDDQKRAERAPNLRAAARTLTARDGWDAIATYNTADKILTVTDHLAADALLCITYGQGAEPVCKLPVEWLRR